MTLSARILSNRYFLLVVVALLFSQSIFAQGVKFLNTDFDKLIAEAKRQNKLAFVEVYLNGCPHCEALAPVLTDKKVGDYYNPRFVSMKVEANSALSKALQNKQKLFYPEFPLLFYFDATGKLLHQATPAEKPNRTEFIEEVIRHAADAQSPEVRTSSYPTRYAQGERSVDFLIKYGRYAQATRDTTLVIAIADDLGKLFTQPADLESTAGFYIISRLIPDFQNPMARYFFGHLDTYRSKHGAQPTQQAGESILFQTLYGKKSATLSSSDVVAVRQAMESLGIPANVAAMRTILKELEAYFRESNTAAATARFDEYRRANALSLQDYAYLVRFFNERATDTSHAAPLVGWVNDALASLPPADRNKAEVAELYREQSEAYRRLGNKTEGKKAAEKALSIAKIAKVKLDSFVKQVGKF
ncbi:MAG: thioredoxin family protein [Bacteroidetes bacterium]|nr:thioredoxin family protein [Bacteroidota bacterium]